MESNELKALFALIDAFPSEHHYVNEFDRLIITIPLTPAQADFLEKGKKMFEPL